MTHRLQRSAAAQGIAVSVALLLLSLITGFSQVKTEGLAWQEQHYLPRLESVVAGTAPAPWQYRILTDSIVVALCRTVEAFGIPRAVGACFVSIRLGLNLALFALAYAFYRRLGLGRYTIVLGLSALAWGMTQANYGSDLAFNGSVDILLYLAAAIALCDGKYRLIVPITVLAAFNRETSGLIPVMALAHAVTLKPRAGVDRPAAIQALMALGLYMLIFAGLRVWFGERPWAGFDAGAVPGLGFLWLNLSSGAAWGHATGVLSIVPILAVLAYRDWPPILRSLFWATIPAWCTLHLFLAPLSESRVLLLPQILVFVPAMLCGVQAAHLWTPERAAEVRT